MNTDRLSIAPSIRDANPDDLPVLLELEQKVIAAERPFNAHLKDQGAWYYDIGFLISDPSSKLVVMEADADMIATGYVQIRNSKPAVNHEQHGYLGFMLVEKAYRGRGLNRILMQHLIDWGKAQGVNHFYLDVYADNSAAVRAYEKLGFKPSLLEMKLDSTE